MLSFYTCDFYWNIISDSTQNDSLELQFRQHDYRQNDIMPECKPIRHPPLHWLNGGSLSFFKEKPWSINFSPLRKLPFPCLQPWISAKLERYMYTFEPHIKTTHSITKCIVKCLLGFRPIMWTIDHVLISLSMVIWIPRNTTKQGKLSTIDLLFRRANFARKRTFTWQKK
jgi:hypothetical protein